MFQKQLREQQGWSKGKDGGKSSSVFSFLFSLMTCHVPFLRILMGKRAPLSLRFNFLCTGSLHSHSFEIMAYYDVLGPTPSAGKTYLFCFTGSLSNGCSFNTYL